MLSDEGVKLLTVICGAQADCTCHQLALRRYRELTLEVGFSQADAWEMVVREDQRCPVCLCWELNTTGLRSVQRRADLVEC